MATDYGRPRSFYDLKSVSKALSVFLCNSVWELSQEGYA